MSVIRKANNLKLLLVIFLLILVPSTLAGCLALYRQPPIAIAMATPTSGEAPLTVEFDGSQSSDPDGTIVNYAWDFDDGTQTSGATLDKVTHTFTNKNVFKVVLTVTDDKGLIGKDKVYISTLRASIYFASDRVQTTSVKYEIFKMYTDGGNQSRVTNDPLYNDLWPDLTRNTRGKLAFTSDRDDPASGVGVFDVFTANGDGSLSTNLTLQTPSHDIQPSWSPESDEIVFASNRSENWELWKMDADGTNPAQFTSQTPYFAIAPAWSPINDDIVFVSDESATGNTSIWIWEEGAASPTELYDSAGQDGALGLTMCNIPGTSFCGGRPPGTRLPNWAGISTPSWSPDGSKLAFTTDQGGNADIYTCEVNSCTTTASPLANAADGLYEEFDPFWFKDENGDEWIAFVSNRTPGPGYQIWKVKPSGSNLTQLTTTGNHNVTPADEVFIER